MNNISISESSKVIRSDLSISLKKGEVNKVHQILMRKKESNEEFSLTEKWQLKAYNNEDFNDEEFLKLDSDTKNLCYKTANQFNQISFIARLNGLGLISPTTPPRSPSIISSSMDGVEIKKTLRAYLSQLREKKLLGLWREKPDFCTFKKEGFSRILGREYLAELIVKLNLKHIKVPRKYCVVSPPLFREEITFKVEMASGLFMDIDSPNIEIYAEKIIACRRKLSREEILEYILLLEQSYFTDIIPQNCIIAEDGFYIIDTELASFSMEPVMINDIYSLIHSLNKIDQPWFSDLLKEKSKVENKDELLGFNVIKKFYNRSNASQLTTYHIVKELVKEYKAISSLSKEDQNKLHFYTDFARSSRRVRSYMEKTFIFHPSEILT